MESLTADDPQAIGGFRLQARLGAGAMGRVYLAASPAGRMVAVKVLRPELARDQEFIRRFRAEVDSARLVSRIYTAPVVAAGVDDVPPWLATAFVPGPSLDDVISRFGPLPVTALWRLAAGLAEALRAIHAVGLVHRDLKPGNVLLAYDGPRVIDFGISRATAEGRLTRTGPVVGTMGYLSPEQAQGHVAEPPSDVFSLGCVLAFAATGASPFSVGADALPAAVVYRVVQEEPDLGPVPVQFRRLIQACLAKDPALRPDPGRVAARCAVATEQLGLPPASFWPSDFADIIGAQQTALTAELQVLHVHPSPAPAAGRRQATRVPHRCWSHRGDRWRKRGRVGARLEYVAAAGQGHRQPRTKGPGHAGLDLPDKPGGERQPGGGERRRLPRQRGRRALRRRCHDGARTLVVARQLGHCRPTLTNGILCVSAAQGDFYAVQAATGTLAWDLSGNKLDPFARNWAANGAHVAVAIGDQTVRMYKATDGKSRWIATTSDESGFGQLVAASGDAVYAVGAHGALYALQASTGHEVYRVQVLRSGDAPATNLVMSGGTLYLGAKSGLLYALHPASGKVKWAAQPGGGFPGSDPVVTDGMVYFTDSDAVLRAVDAATGKQQWTYHTGGKPTAGPAVAGDFVYVCSSGGLQQLHAKTGKPGWTYTAPSGAAFSATPAVAGGLVLAACEDASLSAIRA